MTDPLIPASGDNNQPTDPNAAGAPAPAPAPAPADPAPAPAPADPAAAPTVPDKYEFKAPEGVAFNAEVLGEFEVMAKGLKLPQAQAQQLADLGAKLMQKATAEQTQAIEATTQEWAATSLADPEFGGTKLEASLATGKQALSTFGTDAFKQFLEDSRLGDHPEMVRFMYRVGNAIGTDKFVPGSVGAGAKKESRAQSMYPSMNP